MAKSQKANKANKKAKKANKAEAPKTEDQKVDTPEQGENAQAEAPKAEAPKAEAPKSDKKAKKAKNGKKADKADKPKIRTLKVLTNLLNSKIKASAKTSIDIGTLIAEAQGHFKKTKEWLAWSDDNFGMKKASHYNYVKIATVFGSTEMKEAFADVTIRILGALTRDDAMLDAALIALKEEIPVDAEWLKDYKADKAEAEKAERKASGTENDEDKAEEKEEARKQKVKDDAEREEAYIREMEAKIDDVDVLVEDAKVTALAEHMTAVAKHLGKLKPHQVLGCDSVADKRAVNKAKRALNALYKGHTDVLEVIAKASDAMA